MTTPVFPLTLVTASAGGVKSGQFEHVRLAGGRKRVSNSQRWQYCSVQFSVAPQHRDIAGGRTGVLGGCRPQAADFTSAYPARHIRCAQLGHTGHDALGVDGNFGVCAGSKGLPCQSSSDGQVSRSVKAPGTSYVTG
ncbi:hypothetical protein ACG98G_05785 [Megasphaera hexanoica]|uniref:Uncharacterized protein n=1 Tax=Megasphaera hexanoica TaxID=1675036 RepID=A0ABW7DQZ2_9FIRM|nr:hypothetical protein [Megasphaera hexanoica]